MSLQLIIYRDIFEHSEVHQGELSFFLLTRTKKEKKKTQKGNCFLVFITQGQFLKLKDVGPVRNQL